MDTSGGQASPSISQFSVKEKWAAALLQKTRMGKQGPNRGKVTGFEDRSSLNEVTSVEEGRAPGGHRLFTLYQYRL